LPSMYPTPPKTRINPAKIRKASEKVFILSPPLELV
jgi:hypothetical protein